MISLVLGVILFILAINRGPIRDGNGTTPLVMSLTNNDAGNTSKNVDAGAVCARGTCSPGESGFSLFSNVKKAFILPTSVAMTGIAKD